MDGYFKKILRGINTLKNNVPFSKKFILEIINETMKNVKAKKILHYLQEFYSRVVNGARTHDPQNHNLML